MKPFSRAWAEVNLSALAYNIHQLYCRFSRPGSRVMAVVKADAYGHGLANIVPTCLQNGLTDFGVATVEEGVALRALAPDAAIYLLAPILPDEAPEIVAHGFIPLISSLELARALSEAAQKSQTPAQAHLDVDTGMGRAGVQPDDAPALLAVLDSLPGLQITGLATHMARADEDPGDALMQWASFADLLTLLSPRAQTLLVHSANSPASFFLKRAPQSLVRPGLLLYGIEPNPGAFGNACIDFRPVLSLKTRVILCRPLPGGATISYGKTYTVPPGGGVYATLGIGYGDGYSRRLSNLGSVLIRGQHAPICGRVCMDQTVVNVSHIPGVTTGDIATLVGADGSQTLTAGDLAALIDATPHEISTCLTPRIPRILSYYPLPQPLTGKGDEGAGFGVGEAQGLADNCNLS